jgi:hypothetical protein
MNCILEPCVLRDKTLTKIKLLFYWPGMKDFVKKYCESCACDN